MLSFLISTIKGRGLGQYSSGRMDALKSPSIWLHLSYFFTCVLKYILILKMYFLVYLPFILLPCINSNSGSYCMFHVNKNLHKYRNKLFWVKGRFPDSDTYISIEKGAEWLQESRWKLRHGLPRQDKKPGCLPGHREPEIDTQNQRTRFSSLF